MRCAVGVLAVLFCGSSLLRAQDSNTQTTIQTSSSVQVHKVSSLMESTVTIQGGARIGKIVDVVLSSQGCLEYVVVEYETKYVLVPWIATRVDFQSQTVVLNITRERFEQVPTFTRGNFPNLANTEFSQRVYQAFGLTRQGNSQGGATINSNNQPQQPGSGNLQPGKLDRGSQPVQQPSGDRKEEKAKPGTFGEGKERAFQPSTPDLERPGTTNPSDRDTVRPQEGRDPGTNPGNANPARNPKDSPRPNPDNRKSDDRKKENEFPPPP